MTLHASMLFFHIVGILLLFTAFGLEWICFRNLRKTTSLEQLRSWTGAAAVIPRFHAISGPLIILTGAYLATKMKAWPQGWISMSLLAIVVMIVLGAVVSGRKVRGLIKDSAQQNAEFRGLIGRTYDPVLRYSLRLRIALGLGVVYLMGSKAPMGLSLAVMGVATLLGVLASVKGPQPASA